MIDEGYADQENEYRKVMVFFFLLENTYVKEMKIEKPRIDTFFVHNN